MTKGIRLAKKLTNVAGIVMIMLGTIPAPVLAQVSASAQGLGDAQAVKIQIATSYTALLGETISVTEPEMLFEVPDISAKNGAWIGAALAGPVLADEDPTADPTAEPAEEPAGDPTEEPAQEPAADPAEEPAADPTAEPADEPAGDPAETPDQEPAADPTEESAADPTEEPAGEEGPDQCPEDDNKVKPGVCGCGVADTDSDGDGKKNCEDDCPQDATNTCHDAVAEESGDAEQGAEPETVEATEDESVVEEVTAIADAGLVLVNEDEESVSLASNEAVEIIQSADPYFTSGGTKYCFIKSGDPCAGDCHKKDGTTGCETTTSPIQDAIDHAASNIPDDDTLYIEAGSYSGFTINNFGADLTIMAAGQGSTFINGQINLTNNTHNIRLSDFSVDNAGNTPTINALNNSGTITLRHLSVASDHDSGVWVDNHSGDVFLDDVDVDVDGNDEAAYIDNTAGSGNVQIDDSTFKSDKNTGLDVRSAGDVFLDDVDVDVDGNDEAAYIDNTAGSGNVQIDDSTFKSDKNTGLDVRSAGEVKLDNVTSSNNGNCCDPGHGAVIDNTAGDGDKNVTVLNSTFNNNKGDGLRVFSDGWILLDNVAANDNQNKGAYLQTSGPGVMVLNSEFKDDFWSWFFGISQVTGLEIRHTGGDHETTLCDVVATWNRGKQIKLTSPAGDENSSFLYNFCDVDTGGDEIEIYGGAEWETVQNPPCPTGQVRGGDSVDRPNSNRCYQEDWDREGKVNYECTSGHEHNGSCYANRFCILGCIYWGYIGPATVECPSGQVPGDRSAQRPNTNICYSQDWDRKGHILKDMHGNITVNEWETDGVWSQKYINLLHPCGEESGGGCCGCCCNGSEYDQECPHCDEVCELPPACGDGIKQADLGEECDDGNIINGDGCSSTCEVEEFCGDQIVNGEEECDGQEHCLPNCTWEEWCGDNIINGEETCDDGGNEDGDGCSAECQIEGCTDPDAPNYDETAVVDDESCEPYCGDGIIDEQLGETCDSEEYCRPEDCTYCGDALINGNETCDPAIEEQDYCNQECKYKEFADLVLDPGCVGVGTLGWSVINPNSFSVPNVTVVVDGVNRFDGTFPANTEVGMGTTPDGPLTHNMRVTWPHGDGAIRSNELCEPEFVPAALPIPVTGEEFIIPVTGADILDALAQQQRLLVTGGAALLGISIWIGGRKKRK